MTDGAATATSTPPFAAGAMLLPGPTGVLELACAVPAPDVARAASAIICHPHSLQGGAMGNKVVTTLERSLLDLGVATVRFNFRGVGASEGVYADGIGEVDDLLAVAAWLRAARPGDALWLAGFSFGSYVALRASATLQPAQLILVAPPVGRWDFADLHPSDPCLIVQGDADEVVDAPTVYAWAASLTPAPRVIRMAQTSHFFHRRLVELRTLVKEALGADVPPLLHADP